MLQTSERTVTLLTDNNNEPFRLDRLARVVRHVARNNPGTLAFVITVHDHAGLLSVNWRTSPPLTSLAAVVDAWATEHEFTSNHYVKSRWLIGDVGQIAWPAASWNANRSMKLTSKGHLDP